MHNLVLISGSPGSGKTTVALIVAKTILGDYVNDYALILNASDERKLEHVRNRIKTFARYFDRRVDVPFRIVILDEADAMTSDAQTALRRIMEDFSNTTRFILTCNYSSDIIEPIQSRCALFRFTHLPEKDLINYLQKICEKEDITCNSDALNVIYDYSNGDVRHAINILQVSSSFGKITVNNVRKITGMSLESKVSESINLALNDDFNKAREMMIDLIRVYGIPERDFIRYAYRSLKDSHYQKELAKIFAKYDSRLNMSASPEIQLSALLAEINSLSKSESQKKLK